MTTRSAVAATAIGVQRRRFGSGGANTPSAAARLADRLRSELRAYRLQGLDTGREREAVAANNFVEFPEQGYRFVVC